MPKGFLATVQLDNLTKVKNYPILPDDLLVEDPDGTFMKVCPGVAIGGMTLTPEQKATLREVEYEVRHLNYIIHDKA